MLKLERDDWKCPQIKNIFDLTKLTCLFLIDLVSFIDIQKLVPEWNIRDLYHVYRLVNMQLPGKYRRMYDAKCTIVVYIKKMKRFT